MSKLYHEIYYTNGITLIEDLEDLQSFFFRIGNDAPN